jgi:hypothetical protein
MTLQGFGIHANMRLANQVSDAVRAGDRTSFESAKKAIVDGYAGKPPANVAGALSALASSTKWKPDAGGHVIGLALRNAAGAMSVPQWNNKDGVGLMVQLQKDFDASAPVEAVKRDVAAVAAAIRGNADPASANLRRTMQQAVAYAQNGYKAGLDPATVDVNDPTGTTVPSSPSAPSAPSVPSSY